MALLGRTAQGLFWMQRYIERAENMARLLDAGLRISMTNLSAGPEEWQSIVTAAGVEAVYRSKHESFEPETVINFLLRDRDNSSSVLSSIETARTNGRMVRTALTRDVWESLNEGWIHINRRLSHPVTESELPAVLELVKRQTAYVRGTFYGTQLRNEIFDFCNLGTFIERADNTARILDVKYWVLLPNHSSVGSPLDIFQWGSILRSVSAHRSYTWEYHGDYTALNTVDFLILNRRMPRSLAHSYERIHESLSFLARTYGREDDCHHTAGERFGQLSRYENAGEIVESGLHEFLEAFIRDNNRLAGEIAQSYGFYV
ncbi:alpha-E domain-containing protein [Consotaella aegiceratis]|uniref:alpha-E domain-containing protein n=1 Tax=Consotaella aegiceratis TaxID=3097961 RepID=UPI002F407FB2